MSNHHITDEYFTPICPTCKREDPTVKAQWCFECFIQWYDPDSGVDQTSRLSVGNHVRKKHGLPPLTE